ACRLRRPAPPARPRGGAPPPRPAVRPGAPVRQVVPRPPGHRGVPQPHGGHRLGHPPRLVPIQLGRPAGVDLAEVAAPGALVAADQEGGLPILPALVDVRAAGLLADRVQPLAPDQRLQFGVLGAGAQPGPDPRRLALDRGLRVANLQPQQPASLWRDRHPTSVPTTAQHPLTTTLPRHRKSLSDVAMTSRGTRCYIPNVIYLEICYTPRNRAPSAAAIP